MSDQTDQAETQALEETVFTGVLRWFSAGALCVSLLILVQATKNPALMPTIIGPLVLVALIPAFLIVRNRIGYPRSAIAFLSYLLCVCAYIQCVVGLAPGVALGTVTLPVLSGLFFGVRGARWAFAAALVSMLLAAIISTRAPTRAWLGDWWDPQSPIVWLRYAVVFLFFGGAIVWAFGHLNEGLTQKRAALRATLERESVERARRERTQEALEQAQRLSALAQFAGGLAHDFNNSLMVIMGGATLISEDETIDAHVRAQARDILRSVEISAGMVRQLLTLGHPAPPEPKRIHAEVIVQQCRSTMRRLLPEPIEFRVEVESHDALRVDVARMQQALLNLTLNARDALGARGSFTLRAYDCAVREVPAGFAARPGRFVVIACEDTGSGMDERTRSHVFEPFFTTKAAGKGTGLGLAMVHRLVREADGFVTVESEPNVGTTFRLHFPALPAEAREERASPAPAVAPPS